MKLLSNASFFHAHAKFFAIATAIVAVAFFFLGCTTIPEWGGPKQASDWAYAPASVVVHPLSRFRNSSKQDEDAMIIVHIVFLDGDGFACRGLGDLTISLTNNQHATLSIETVNLEDEDNNRLRFDNVTRSYRVHFDQLPEQLDRVWIQATLLASGGELIKSKRHLLVNRKNN